MEILDAAWDLIAIRGTEVSMAEIAKSAGISRQAVYLHFGTRGGLLMALVKRADERFAIREGFLAAMAAPTAADRLAACLDAWLAFVPKILPVATDLIRLRATDPDASAAWEDRMAELRSWLRELLQTVAADGALAPPWTVDDAADYVWVASSVQVWSLLVVERDWPPKRAAAVLKATIMKTLLSEPTAPTPHGRRRRVLRD